MIAPSWIHDHRKSILFLLFSALIAGIFTSWKMPTTLFPTIDFPQIRVKLEAGDRPADQMLLLVTMPIEEAVRRVPGVQTVRSTTSRGSAEISVFVSWGVNTEIAELKVNQEISQIISTLPPETTFSTRRYEPTIFPIIAYSLTSDRLSPIELRDFAQYQLRPLLFGIDGIADIKVMGTGVEEYHVLVDSEKLRAFDLTINDISNVFKARNIFNAVGKLEDKYSLYLAISDTQFQNIDELYQTVIRSGINGQVVLEDVAKVERSVVPQWIKISSDTKDAVSLEIFQQPGSNSVQISDKITSILKEFKPQIPSEVNFVKWYDQSELVLKSSASVRDAILIGILLSGLILIYFLGNIRIISIALIIVPVVLASTVVSLYFLQMSFNIMTLGGMAAAVGLIIDDSIVLIEHIVRRYHERINGKKSGVYSPYQAAREFFQPLSGSSAATIIIFLPLAFLNGVVGAFFKVLSLTMAIGLFISFLFNWLAVPILAQKILTSKKAFVERESNILILLKYSHHYFLMHFLSKPWLILCFLVPLLGAGIFSFLNVGSGFMPKVDEGGFVLDYKSLPGTALSETNRLLSQVEHILHSTPEVKTFSRRTGIQLGGGLTEANEGDIFIRLKPFPRRSIEEVMDTVRRDIETQVPGLDIEFAQLMEDLIGDLTSVPQPIEIKIFSDESHQLFDVSQEILQNLSNIPGVVDVKEGIHPAGNSLEIHIDQVKAALEGVDPASITDTVKNFVSGIISTQVEKPLKMVGIRVWVPEQERKSIRDLENIQIRAPDGHLFPLKRVARIIDVLGQPQIARENLKRMVAVTARISGSDLGSVISDVKKMLKEKIHFPKGSYYELGGLYKQQQIAFKQLISVFVAALILVFFLLLFLYESFLITIVIILMPLLSLAAVFIGLWLTGIELNISSMMGMTMIIGIITEVAIFFFSEYQKLIKTTGPKTALLLAGTNRIRPIAMTTFATILTLLPLAFALGEGAGMQQPLAIAIISGLIIQLPLVLLIMPVLYSLLIHKKE